MSGITHFAHNYMEVQIIIELMIWYQHARIAQMGER